MKRVELGIVLGTNYRLGRVAQYVGQKVRPRGSGEKRAEDELPSWRSMRSLTVKRNCPGSAERESRPKGRNHGMIVVYADVGVKGNRRAHLCKRSGGDGERRGSEDPPLQKRKGAAARAKRGRIEVRGGGGAYATDRVKKDFTPRLGRGRRRSQRRGGH